MYEGQTYDLILKRMLARVSNKMDKREGSVIWDTHSPTAIEFQILYLELENIIKEGYASTASREFLILRCKEHGITPYPATKAVLKGAFTPATVDVIGKRFSINTLNYVVTEKISAGIYKVQCETAGIIGNQFLGRMLPIEYIKDLQTAELTEVLIPGDDEEETEALRKRYLSSLSPIAFGGNRADYMQKIRTLDGVGCVKVERKWINDNRHIIMTNITPNADVQYWYEHGGTSGMSGDVKNWIDKVYKATKEQLVSFGGTVAVIISNSENYGAASETLIDSIQAALDPVNRNPDKAGEGWGYAPIGHVVHVQSVNESAISLKINVTFASGIGETGRTAAKEQARAAIENYFLELRKEWEETTHLHILPARIIALVMSVDGIYNVEQVLINGSTDSLMLTGYNVPVIDSFDLYESEAIPF